MLAVIISKMVGEMMCDSIYIEHIRMNGLPLLDTASEGEYLHGDIARDAMHGRQLRVLTLSGIYWGRK